MDEVKNSIIKENMLAANSVTDSLLTPIDFTKEPVIAIRDIESSGISLLDAVIDSAMKRDEENMKSNQPIIDRMRIEVYKYAVDHLDPTDRFEFSIDDVYVVWQTKVLQNWKALLSTNLPDGMYYECTYNGDKNEIYFDAYKKFENRVIPFE